ncbi:MULTISPECIES: phosphoglucosamine mutase [unclassified Fusibacter]|uniref:phosphoglucosamine mutase n=1 Tax=unclassified Fusibacter TaxID=2624464 RepID=UPI0010104D60|nr:MULTISPECIES: phosphoglucosamine mutase [unclassified Fusibacter]MCK8059490.1 phosphoglucosamine mutase [Fusibacter sp. A2]NPE21046.1 phosphoglucosamine mutase [Fusibacter sp. A1]RXV62321.1 phosphoglucosamine mutase [Fusibacter sp. A1]
MSRLFGTDGVRGVANVELTSELAFKLGKYGAYVLSKGKKGARIVIGKDTRVSGYMLEASLMAGIMSAGCDAYLVGVTPTPAIPHLIKHYNADAGVMISASHNPVEFNGIKFFSGNGFKLTDEQEDEIEGLISGAIEYEQEIGGTKVGRRIHHFEANHVYATKVKETVTGDLTGLKIAMDCANGASFEVAPSTLRELGAEVVVINNHPDGLNINKDCGSTHLDKVARLTKEVGADLGLAFDGDADRMLAVDENGEEVDGDKIMVIIAKALAGQGKLKHDTVVSTVMSNMGFDKALESVNLKSVKTQVGDRYVLEAMKEGGYSIGGEQSGHVIMLEYNTTGDGLLSALHLATVLKESGKKMSELASIMTVYPQIMKNTHVPNDEKHKILDRPEIKTEIDAVEKALGNDGRLLIRASGTEPLVRVMLEGSNLEVIRQHCDTLIKVIEDVYK